MRVGENAAVRRAEEGEGIQGDYRGGTMILSGRA